MSAASIKPPFSQSPPPDAHAQPGLEDATAGIATEGTIRRTEPEVFVRNREVIMVPEDNPANIGGDDK